jgi:hypothetical protein
MINSLEEAIKHCDEVAEEQEWQAYKSVSRTDDERMSCKECASDHRQLAEWLKRLKRIEDYIADGKDDMECTYSLYFWEIEAVMNGEI